MNSKKLNILFVTIAFPSTKDLYNGMFIKETAKCIAHEHNVTVLHCDTIRKTSSHSPGIFTERIDNVDVVHVFIKESFLPKTLLTTLGILKGLNYIQPKFSIDLIHAHLFSSAIPFLWRLKNIPLVLTEHWSGFPLNQLGFLKIIAKLVMRRSKTVCPVSEFLRKSIESHGIKANFKVINNPVDLNYFFLKKKEPNNIIKILTVARQDPIKGIDNLLVTVVQLSKQRNDFHLDIIGGGQHLEKYRTLSKQLQVEKYVTFHGKKDKSFVAQFMQGCNFLVNSSLSENQPVSINEAICCGKPIVATSVGGNIEAINSKIGILVKPNDHKSLKDGMLFMCDNFKNYNPTEIADIGKLRYGFESIREQYQEVYKRAFSP